MIKMLIFCLLLLTSFSLNGQTHRGKCGMTVHDQKPLVEFVEEYFKSKKDHHISNRGESVYVPVIFHLVATNEGESRIGEIATLKQFERVRVDYKEMNINLYLYDQGMNYIDNASVYSSPGSSQITNLIASYKNDNAIDVFITQNASTSSAVGSTLGFYSRIGDFIVVRQNEVLSASSTLSHELGHFFSLPHTFFGWENVSEYYDWPLGSGWQVNEFNGQVDLIYAPGTQVLVELQDGSNCAGAADKICDTPPDYNFGFGAERCSWNEELLDRNGDLVVPMVDNYMGYFLDCDAYQFTQGQEDVIRAVIAQASYGGFDRSYLKSNYIPTTDTVNHDYELVYPTHNQKTEYYDQLRLDWSDAQGATDYIVEMFIINTESNTSRKIVEKISTSHLDVNYFNPNEIVTWRVLGYNESYGGAPILESKFTTGTGSVHTTELNPVINNLSINPSFITVGNPISVDVKVASNIKASLTIHGINGNVAVQKHIHLFAGNNNIQLESDKFSKGIYILNFSWSDGNIAKKIIVN